MKKIFLLIFLCSISVFSQAEFDGRGIKLTENVSDPTATRVNVQSSNNLVNWLSISELQKEKAYLSTGLLSGGNIVPASSPSKFNIAPGTAVFTAFPAGSTPSSTSIFFGAKVDVTPDYLTTSNITYLAIDLNGNLYQSASEFTADERRNLATLGAVIHSNNVVINAINSISNPSNGATSQLHDFMDAVGALNLSGNKIATNGANLTLQKSAGTIFKLGSNFPANFNEPHKTTQAAAAPVAFRYRTMTGVESLDLTNVNPNLYNPSGATLTAVPNNRYTIQTVTVFQSGAVRVQYGQSLYNTQAAAQADIFTRSYQVEPNIASQGVTRAYIVVRGSTTDLTNTADAIILEAAKFGGASSSGGGGSVTSAAIIAALGYVPENQANKQNSLAVDATDVKYPTVSAVNTGLGLKANVDNVVTLTGNQTISGSKTFSSASGTATMSSALGAVRVDLSTTSSIPGININSTVPGAMGLSFKVQELGLDTFTISKQGNATANAYVKTGGVATERLLANGAVENFTPRKTYKAIVSQTGTNAPLATVLENTLGVTATWTRAGSGNYSLTISGTGIFLTTKTFVYAVGNTNLDVKIKRVSNTELNVTGAISDGSLVDVSIQVDVY